MPKKVAPPQKPEPDITRELRYVNAHLAAVERLIRALEEYRQFKPKLVIKKTRTA